MALGIVWIYQQMKMRLRAMKKAQGTTLLQCCTSEKIRRILKPMALKVLFKPENFLSTYKDKTNSPDQPGVYRIY